MHKSSGSAGSDVYEMGCSYRYLRTHLSGSVAERLSHGDVTHSWRTGRLSVKQRLSPLGSPGKKKKNREYWRLLSNCEWLNCFHHEAIQHVMNSPFAAIQDYKSIAQEQQQPGLLHPSLCWVSRVPPGTTPACLPSALHGDGSGDHKRLTQFAQWPENTQDFMSPCILFPEFFVKLYQ